MRPVYGGVLDTEVSYIEELHCIQYCTVDVGIFVICDVIVCVHLLQEKWLRCVRVWEVTEQTKKIPGYLSTFK